MDIGAELRRAREARGLSLDAVSRATRVQLRILSAIEQNDSRSIPPRPYGRGFVRAYAAEVGLDPEATVRQFFSQFDAPESHGEPPPAAAPPVHTPVNDDSPRRWTYAAAMIAAYAVIGAAVVMAGRWALQDRGEAGAVGTSGPSGPPPVAVAAAPAAATVPAPVPTPSVSVALEAQRPSWVTASVDGERAIFRTLLPGERISLKGLREISIRTGDAGALTWQRNGGPAAPMGRSGEVLTVRLTPGNVSGAQ